MKRPELIADCDWVRTSVFCTYNVGNCMHLSHASSNIMDSSIPYIKDLSIDDATTIPVAQLGVCFCSARGHGDSMIQY